MKSLIASLCILGVVGTAMGMAVWAADTGTVTASVTVKYAAVSIDVAETTFAYGSLNPNTASTTLALFGTTGITATNDGSNADFDIYGADTTGSGTGWTLAANTTGNNYIHKFCNDTDDDCTAPPAQYTALTTSPQELKTPVASAGTVNFQLEITTPTTPTDFSGQSAVVTVQATAI